MTLVSAGAFAQGKIAFANDSLHLVYYATDGSAASGLAGTAVSSANLPAGVTLVADLYGGTSSASLSLISTTSFGAVAGRYASINNLLAGPVAPGTTGFFQVQVRDTGHTNAASAQLEGAYWGFSAIFTTTAGSGTAYNSIVNPNNPAFSTWAGGNFDMSTQTGLAGARGVLAVATPVPEPTTLVLGGLGLAAGMILRRRK